MIYSLQAFRGLSTLMVLSVHSASIVKSYFGNDVFLNNLHFGRGSVPYFFILSGFIIYYIHRQDIGNKAQVSDYIAKRAVRIYPIYWVVTLMLLPIWMFNPGIGESYHREFSSLIMSLLLLPQNNPPHIEVAWTLTHELLFYLHFFQVLCICCIIYRCITAYRWKQEHPFQISGIRSFLLGIPFCR